MPSSFQSLCTLLEKIERTRKRHEIIDQTADYLKELYIDEIEPAVNMMIGRPVARSNQNTLNVNWLTLAHVLESETQIDWNLFKKTMRTTGDIGLSTEASLEKAKANKQTQLSKKTLTILEVKKTFDTITQSKGSRSRIKKERLIAALISQSTPAEAKYLVKIFTGEMRTGLQEGLMEQAVATAFNVPLNKVQTANMILSNLGQVATILKRQGRLGIEAIDFEVFRPVLPMLAQSADSIKEALSEQGGKSALEYKYDGARIQIHKKNNEVRLFSRRLTDLTNSLPEIVETIKENIEAKSAILEGEVIAQDPEGFPIAFQHLMRRFKRTKNITKMKEKIPLTLYLFDILYLKNERQIVKPYIERRQILSQNVGNIHLTAQIVTDKPQKAEKFLEEALATGHEGLMAKKIDSYYTPGRRGKQWLKIKPTLEPLDLVITAAEYGYGRRTGWLSDYYLAARDTETGEFLIVGKTFKGLTDTEIIDLTKQLNSLMVAKEGHKVIVIPKIVVEVAYNEIQLSPKYRSKMALRFARITRIRDDKSAEDADTITRVKEIYERQFRIKGKYKVS